MGILYVLVSKAHFPPFKSYEHPTFGCQKAIQAASQQSWVCLSQLVCPPKQAEGHIDPQPTHPHESGEPARFFEGADKRFFSIHMGIVNALIIKIN